MTNGNLKTKQELVVKQAHPRLKKIPMYHICLLNDDYTPMDFVVEILERFFYKEHAVAIDLMLQVHTKGKAVCDTCPKEIAETKALLVNDYAKIQQHPLVCIIEPAD